MQRAYISKLMELAERDRNVLHILADSGTGYDEMFRMNFPEQIYNFGISEQNMVGAAAGMATAGKIPFVYTAGAFLAYRALEFIRDDVCFQNLNVKIIGMGSGLSWSTLGPTHHTTEDVAMLRVIPNLMIFSPATPLQLAACVEKAYVHKGPVYIRVGMNHEKEFYGEDYVLPDGRNEVLRQGRDAYVITTGSILREVDEAVSLLAEDGLSVGLVNVHSVKPFDEASVFALTQQVKLLFTVEEHSIYGGLGGMVAELLAERGSGCKLRRIGLQDNFAVGYGTLSQVREANGFDAQSLCRRMKEALV